MGRTLDIPVQLLWQVVRLAISRRYLVESLLKLNQTFFQVLLPKWNII